MQNIKAYLGPKSLHNQFLWMEFVLSVILAAFRPKYTSYHTPTPTHRGFYHSSNVHSTQIIKMVTVVKHCTYRKYNEKKKNGVFEDNHPVKPLICLQIHAVSSIWAEQCRIVQPLKKICNTCRLTWAFMGTGCTYKGSIVKNYFVHLVISVLF